MGGLLHSHITLAITPCAPLINMEPSLNRHRKEHVLGARQLCPERRRGVAVGRGQRTKQPLTDAKKTTLPKNLSTAPATG